MAFLSLIIFNMYFFINKYKVFISRIITLIFFFGHLAVHITSSALEMRWTNRLPLRVMTFPLPP